MSQVSCQVLTLIRGQDFPVDCTKTGLNNFNDITVWRLAQQGEQPRERVITQHCVLGCLPEYGFQLANSLQAALAGAGHRRRSRISFLLAPRAPLRN